jgi:hypothetical protein
MNNKRKEKKKKIISDVGRRVKSVPAQGRILCLDPKYVAENKTF